MEKIDAILVFIPERIEITRLAIEQLNKYANIRNIYLISNPAGLGALKDTAQNVKMIPEDTIIPNMTLAELKKMDIYGFPGRAGWYYQQLLKFGLAFNNELTENYLDLSADAIFLNHITFFDNKGRVIMTKASEYHAPYFETYKMFFGEDANYEFSFVAEHIVFNKQIIKEMLKRIEERVPGNKPWPWKIMQCLVGRNDPSLLCEYDIYGHYVKNFHPDKVAFRQMPWTRKGASLTSFSPSKEDIEYLAKRYCLAAFELWDNPKVQLRVFILRKFVFPIRDAVRAVKKILRNKHDKQ